MKNNKLTSELEKFLSAGANIMELWIDELDNEYPFKKSFDELILDIDKWVEEYKGKKK